jgi:hypothetical protein
MECERALSGDVIHCPRCCAELRIPFSSISGAVLRAELIMHAPPPQKAAEQSAPAVNQSSALPEVQEVICPVCESELRVRAGAPKQDGHPRLAELIHKGEPKQPAVPQPAPVSEAPAGGMYTHKQVNPDERERQIAAAREAHPVQVNTPVKPRLSYVLSGKSPNEDQHEKPPEQDQHPPFSE